MIQSAFKRRRVGRAAHMVIFALLLGGCGLVLTPYAAMKKFEHPEVIEDPSNFDDAFIQGVAEEFGILALFAHVVYREDLRLAGSHDRACAYLDSEVEDRYGMPYAQDVAERWMRWKGPKACIDDRDNGLFYETYIHGGSQDMPQEAVIAFRGTENFKGQFFQDWKTNLSALFGFEPAQYRLARAYIPELIAGLQAANKGIRIQVVGHSLGGGLAQQAGYQSALVERVVTFNTSPVSNWTYLRLNHEVRNRYPLIYRIYHGGEILEKVRFITTAFTATRFNRYDLGLQFDYKKSFEGHAMRIVSCTLAQMVAAEHHLSDAAAQHYDRRYAREVVLGSSGLCKADVGKGDMSDE